MSRKPRKSSSGLQLGRAVAWPKTPDEAKHAKPRVTDDTATTELFRWDKNAWFY